MYIKYMNMEKIAKKVENSRALRSHPGPQSPGAQPILCGGRTLGHREAYPSG